MLEKHIQKHIVDCLHNGIYECSVCEDISSDSIFKSTSYKLIYEHLRDVHSFNLTGTIKSNKNRKYLSSIDVNDTSCSSFDSNSLINVTIKPVSFTSNDNILDENLQRFNNKIQQKHNAKLFKKFLCNFCSYKYSFFIIGLLFLILNKFFLIYNI